MFHSRAKCEVVLCQNLIQLRYEHSCLHRDRVCHFVNLRNYTKHMIRVVLLVHAAV